MVPLLLTTRKVHLGLLAMLAASSVAASFLLSLQSVQPLPLGDYHVYRCETGAGQSGRGFRILTVTSALARTIADGLCASSAMARQFSAVAITWGPRDQLSAEQILGEEYDLIWSREHRMHGLVPEFGDYYDTLLHYDHYRVYWFSRAEPPRLDKSYLLSRKIGLLEDKLSHTHYLLPLASLKTLGIGPASENLVYFEDAARLYAAFSSGEIDLISGGLWLARELPAPLYHALISGDATAATLFIRRVHGREVRCAAAASMTVWAPVLDTTRLHFVDEDGCDGRG